MKTENRSKFPLLLGDITARSRNAELNSPPSFQEVEALEHGEGTFEIEDDHESQFASAMAQKAALLLEKQKVKAAEKCLRIGLQHCPYHTECLAYMAICVALGQKDFTKAQQIAKEIIQNNPDDARAYYALGRINLMADHRGIAFYSFRKSRTLAGEDENIYEDLEKIEPRRSPVLPFLGRRHPANHILGWLRARLLGLK